MFGHALHGGFLTSFMCLQGLVSLRCLAWWCLDIGHVPAGSGTTNKECADNADCVGKGGFCKEGVCGACRRPNEHSVEAMPRVNNVVQAFTGCARCSAVRTVRAAVHSDNIIPVLIFEHLEVEAMVGAALGLHRRVSVTAYAHLEIAMSGWLLFSGFNWLSVPVKLVDVPLPLPC